MTISNIRFTYSKFADANLLKLILSILDFIFYFDNF